MVEETLVEGQISDSIALTKSLDDRHDNPASVVWHYFPDADEWRLLIAGPSFDQLLPKDEPRAYQKISEALSDSHPTSLNIGEVKLVKTDHPLIEATRIMVKTPGDGVVRAHFKDNMVNGIFIKEMLVLRSS